MVGSLSFIKKFTTKVTHRGGWERRLVGRQFVWEVYIRRLALKMNDVYMEMPAQKGAHWHLTRYCASDSDETKIHKWIAPHSTDDCTGV